MGEMESSFTFLIAFESKLFESPVPEKEREKITETFIKGKQFRALDRYVRAINWYCIQNAIPAWFGVILRQPTNVSWEEPGWSSDTTFCPGVEIHISFERAWVLDKDFLGKSLLNNLETNSVPAEYALEKAKAILLGKEKDARFIPVSVRTDLANQIVTSFSASKTPNAPWTEELLFGPDPKPEDVRSGKAPIPPKSEIVLATTLLERIPEMKRITRTLMRIARPYDPASFFPASV